MRKLRTVKTRNIEQFLTVMRQFYTYLLTVWLFLAYEFLTAARAIEIHYIAVPNAVKNNSHRPVVLDCNYSIRPDDADLVVQWYLNEELVYQWIPPNKPQSIGVLKNEVDLTHKASDDPKSMYRAVKIMNPTTRLAGEYKCLVSTMGDDDFRLKNMIVFEPERQLIIRKSVAENCTNFTCLASDVYPSPKLLLYKNVDNHSHSRILLPIIEWDMKRDPVTKKYTMSIVGTNKVSDIDPGTLVHCELKIPGTGYVKLKSFLYYSERCASTPIIESYILICTILNMIFVNW